jgi:hypothetical protein
MKQKPLELLTKDAIQLNHYYTIKQPDNKYERLVGAFSTIYDRTSYYGYMFDKPKVSTDSHVVPKLNRTVKTLGESFEVNVLDRLNIRDCHTISEITEKYPKVAAELNKLYTKGWLEAYNQILIDKRNEYTAQVDKLYNEMVTIHTELEYKSDLATLAELDDLLYCEAHSFLLKMEEKIYKKNNPKNLKLYKALQALRDKPIITCESA